MIIVLVFTSVFLCVFCLACHRQNYSYRLLREENKILRDIIENQTGQQRRLAQYNRYIQKTNHDMKHYFIKLSVLMEREKYGQVKKEINEYCRIYIESPDSFITDDYNLNYILNAKNSYISEKNIQLVSDIRISKTIPADIGELSILLGNALDNATEYLVGHRQLRQVINLSVHYEHDVLAIRVKNPVSEDMKIGSTGILHTTKKTWGHGIGLRSIRELTKKYGGDMKITCSYNVFCLEVLLILGRDRQE